jgi:drug/metabolite transporter (DMT)-like permease
MNYISSISKQSQGIIYIIISCLFVSFMIGIVRHLSYNYHVMFILMMRCLFSLLFFIPDLLISYKKLLSTNNFKWHLLRGLNSSASNFVWFYVVSILPLADIVSISFTIPIITVIAAMFIFKEKVDNRIWLSLFLGFLGVLIILRPGIKDVGYQYLFVLISVILWSATNIMTKKLSHTESPKTIVAYLTIIMFAISFPLSIPFFAKIDFNSLCWFVLLGLVSNLAYFFISLAYSKADLSILQPFDFTRLVFTSIIAYFAFGEVIDLFTIIGSLIILFGAALILGGKKNKI